MNHTAQNKWSVIPQSQESGSGHLGERKEPAEPVRCEACSSLGSSGPGAGRVMLEGEMEREREEKGAGKAGRNRELGECSAEQGCGSGQEALWLSGWPGGLRE